MLFALNLAAIIAQAQKPTALTPAQVSALTKDYQTWYTYAYYHVPFACDFKALNVAGKPITKKDFLQQVVAGSALAFANEGGPQPVHQLYAYPGKDAKLRSVSQQLARTALVHVDQLGQLLGVV